MNRSDSNIKKNGYSDNSDENENTKEENQEKKESKAQ